MEQNPTEILHVVTRDQGWHDAFSPVQDRVYIYNDIPLLLDFVSQSDRKVYVEIRSFVNERLSDIAEAIRDECMYNDDIFQAICDTLPMNISFSKELRGDEEFNVLFERDSWEQRGIEDYDPIDGPKLTLPEPRFDGIDYLEKDTGTSIVRLHVVLDGHLDITGQHPDQLLPSGGYCGVDRIGRAFFCSIVTPTIEVKMKKGIPQKLGKLSLSI